MYSHCLPTTMFKVAEHDEDTDLKLLLDDGHGDAEEEEEEEEEEALSLCDLPVELEHREGLRRGEDEENSQDKSGTESESEFEFGIGSWIGSLSMQRLPEMCAADDLFFQGRILPLRRHDSSAYSSEKKSTDETKSSTARPVWRIDSIDSRSSSKGSQHSSSYSMTSTSTSVGSSRVTYSSVSNRFGSCPSPTPHTQSGFPGTNKHRSKCQRNWNSHSSSSSMWEFFRPGLVRAPEIELRNLKTRGNNNNREERRGRSEKKGVGLLGGCKCMSDSVSTSLVLLRSDSRRLGGWRKSHVGSGDVDVEVEEMRRKLMELIETDTTRTMKAKKKKKKKEPSVSEKHHRGVRTFEWLKDLPPSGVYSVLPPC